MKEPTKDWNMVVCERCGLLVGWTRQPKEKPFYCIPCFDHVAHIAESSNDLMSEQEDLERRAKEYDEIGELLEKLGYTDGSLIERVKRSWQGKK